MASPLASRASSRLTKIKLRQLHRLATCSNVVVSWKTSSPSQTAILRSAVIAVHVILFKSQGLPVVLPCYLHVLNDNLHFQRRKLIKRPLILSLL